MNSCSDSLKDKIMEAAAHLPNSKQGGPTFWKVLMDLVIATSETAMRRIINFQTSMGKTSRNALPSYAALTRY